MSKVERDENRRAAAFTDRVARFFASGLVQAVSEVREDARVKREAGVDAMEINRIVRARNHATMARVQKSLATMDLQDLVAKDGKSAADFLRLVGRGYRVAVAHYKEWETSFRFQRAKENRVEAVARRQRQHERT